MVTPTEDYYSQHDGGKFAPILATVATWRAPTFLENVAIDADGAVFVGLFSLSRRSLRSGDARDGQNRGGAEATDGARV